MSRYCFPLFLLLLSLVLPHWALGQQAFDPFPGTQHLYGYRNVKGDSAQHIVTIQQIDTVGNELVKEFRRGFCGAGSRQSCVGGGVGEWLTMYMDRDDSFGKEVRIENNGRIRFVTENQDTFELNLNAPVGVAQSFGPADSVVLVGRGMELVGSGMDSVVTFQTSGPGAPGTWKLSENHGLLQGRELAIRDSSLNFIDRSEFKVAGIPDLGWGAIIPDWEDFLDVPANHLFQYDSLYHHYDGMNIDYKVRETRQRHVLTSDVLGLDTIIYRGVQEYFRIKCQIFVGCDTTYIQADSFQVFYRHINSAHLDNRTFSFVFYGPNLKFNWRMVGDYRIASDGARYQVVTESNQFAYDTTAHALKRNPLAASFIQNRV